MPAPACRICVHRDTNRLCRRNPPTPVKLEDNSATSMPVYGHFAQQGPAYVPMWPVVQDFDWCGEFKETPRSTAYGD